MDIHVYKTIFIQLDKPYLLSRVKSWLQYFLVEYFLQIKNRKAEIYVKLLLGHAASVRVCMIALACARVRKDNSHVMLRREQHATLADLDTSLGKSFLKISFFNTKQVQILKVNVFKVVPTELAK